MVEILLFGRRVLRALRHIRGRIPVLEAFQGGCNGWRTGGRSGSFRRGRDRWRVKVPHDRPLVAVMVERRMGPVEGRLRGTAPSRRFARSHGVQAGDGPGPADL